VEIRTDRGGDGDCPATPAPAALFVLLWAGDGLMATGGGGGRDGWWAAWSARRGVGRAGHVSACRRAAGSNACARPPPHSTTSPSTGCCWRTWTRFGWRNDLGIAPDPSFPEFDGGGWWRSGWVYLVDSFPQGTAGKHSRRSQLNLDYLFFHKINPSCSLEARTSPWTLSNC